MRRWDIDYYVVVIDFSQGASVGTGSYWSLGHELVPESSVFREGVSGNGSIHGRGAWAHPSSVDCKA